MGRVQSLIKPTLYRLTEGLPRHELKLMENEAKECEAALLEEIRILEQAIGINTKSETPDKKKSGGDPLQMHHFTSVDAILTSEITPPDRFFSVSALLGRLRVPLYTPHPPNSSLQLGSQNSATPLSKSSSSSTNTSSSTTKKTVTKKISQDKQPLKEKLSLEKQQSLLTLDANPIYRKKQDSSVLLTLWKRISSHRSAAVFRKPVNPREVPIYAEKIAFPIDLSLIRKMITYGVISSFCDLHGRIGLMCHNCVKFNGRESDYGMITREFESYADDSIMNCVLNHDSSSQKTSQSSSK